MNKKLLMFLTIGALVITGCTGKGSLKTSDQKNSPEQKENKIENRQENAEKKEGKEEIPKAIKEFRYDLIAVERLANLVAVSGNDLSRLNKQTNLLAWITQHKSTEFNSPGGVLLAKVSIQDFVDVVNEFSDKTYSKEEALKLLQSPTFIKYDSKSQATTTFPKDSEIYYYKGDDTLVFASIEKGHNYPQELDKKENWKIEGDSIKINVLDVMTKTRISTITLKLNNKNYTGGHSKSKYYVAEVKSE